MSYYDDANIMFIGGAATGTDGKAGTAKPINGGSPLYVTRGSNLAATRINSNGLIEKGRENLLLKSNLFDNGGLPPSAWSTSNASVTSGQSGYDGSSDAWLLENVSGTGAYVLQSKVVNGVQTASVYAKSGNVDYIYLRLGGSSSRGLYANLSNGTIYSTFGTLIDYSVDSVGNDWYRVSVTYEGNHSNFRIYPSASGSTITSLGDNIYIQDAQLEQGLVATEYIESGATTGKAGLLENEPRYNYPIGGSVPHLLLEPQRTNEIGYSEYLDEWIKNNSPIVTQNYGISPEGVRNSTRFKTTEGRLVYDVNTINADETFSVYMKGSGALRIQIGNDNFYPSVTSEWVRYEFTTTQAVSTNTNVQIRGNGSAVDVELYGAQYERNTYATSYIPNHSGSSVSREIESVTTASVPSLINQDEGTFFLDFEFLDGQTAENQNWIALESENGAERVLIYKAAASNGLRAYLSANNSLVFQANNLVTISPNTRYKIAFRYSTGSQAVYINGSLVHSSTNTYTRGSDLSRVTFNESNVQPSCRVHETITFQSGWDNVDLEILTGATPYQSFAAMAATLNYTVYE